MRGDQFHSASFRCGSDSGDVSIRGVGLGAHDDAWQAPVSKDVGFAIEPGRIMRLGELRHPGFVVTGLNRAEPFAVAETRLDGMPYAEPCYVVGAAGFGTRSDRGSLPAAERLPPHDGAGGGPLMYALPTATASLHWRISAGSSV